MKILKTGFLEKWKEKARSLRVETYALYLAYQDTRTPWYARVCALAVAAYAFSPIDLVPDFIPILGYLDDLVIIPLGILLAVRLIPAEVMQSCREKAAESLLAEKPVGKAAAVIIVMIWVAVAALAERWLWKQWLWKFF